MKAKIVSYFKAGVLAVFILAAGAVNAQEQDLDAPEVRDIDKAHDRVIKLHPLQLGEVYMSLEKLRTERISNEYGIGYIYKSYLKGETDEWQDFEAKDVKGIGIHMSQRHYTSNKKSAPFGFFHGPVFGYRFLVFNENVFELPEQNPSSPDYRFVGRLYQNSVDVSYHIGGQLLLGNHFAVELAGSLGGRVKYAYARSGEELLPAHVIGHELIKDENSFVAATPLAQLKFSVGYSF